MRIMLRFAAALLLAPIVTHPQTAEAQTGRSDVCAVVAATVRVQSGPAVIRIIGSDGRVLDPAVARLRVDQQYAFAVVTSSTTEVASVELLLDAPTGDVPGARVQIERSGVDNDCVGLFDRFFAAGQLRPYRTRIDPDSFDQFHRSEVPNADIDNLHVRYRQANGSCIRTDDASSGNRAAFLHHDRQRTSSWSSRLPPSGSRNAVAAPVAPRFAHAETRILQPLPILGGRCAEAWLSLPLAGSYRVRVTDFTGRGASTPRAERQMRLQVNGN